MKITIIQLTGLFIKATIAAILTAIVLSPVVFVAACAVTAAISIAFGQ